MSKKASKAAKPVKSTKPAAKKAVVKYEPQAREQQNGVSRPGEGSICARVWLALEKLIRADKEPTAGNAFDHLKDVNPATVRTQVQRFRTFHGITRDAKKPARKNKTAAKDAAPAVVSVEVQPDA